MWPFNLACLGFFPFVKALTTPVPFLSLNHTIEMPWNLSTSTLLHSEVAGLELPLRPAYAAVLQDFQIVWTPGDPIQSVVAAHLYYNLYVAFLDLWRDVNNRRITTTIDISTLLYPDLVIIVAPILYLPPDRQLTPNIAAIVFYKMLEKCLMDEPTFWTARLMTRDALPACAATFHTTPRPDAVPVANGGLSNTSSSASAGASGVSGLPSNALDVVSDARITVHVGFQGYIPEPNPRTRWLVYFLAWSFSLTLDMKSTDEVVTFAHGVILSASFRIRDNLRMVVESHGVTAPPGASKLTYDEFSVGIQSILETVFVLSQFEMLDATISKDGWQAATFRIFVIDSPAPGDGNITVA